MGKRRGGVVRLDGSHVIPLNKSVALVGVDGWADGLGGEGPATKARIDDSYQILDFATEPEPQVFRQMKERARKYSQALKPSLIKALKQYQTTIIATHVPPCSVPNRVNLVFRRLQRERNAFPNEGEKGWRSWLALERMMVINDFFG